MMDLMISQKGFLQNYKATSPMPNPPQNSLLGSALHSSHSNFPILAVALIGILATGLLLVSYYIFVIKCCLNWHRIDLLRRFSFSHRNANESLLIVQSSGVENRGLDEAVIRSIPVLQFKKSGKRSELRKERSLCECAVCLNEFQEEEKLRVIPNCSHVFHIDCIDIWLQNNANCPLCRTSISAQSHIMAPIFSPRNRNNESFRDEDYVVIEIGEQNNANQPMNRVQERVRSRAESVSPRPRKLAVKESQNKKKSLNLVPKSMGDECIDIRPKDEQFAVFQPMRRSFSMDSAADPILHLAVQEIMQSHQQQESDASPSEDCSSRFRRSFFTFGHGRSSRSTVLPLHLDP